MCYCLTTTIPFHTRTLRLFAHTRLTLSFIYLRYTSDFNAANELLIRFGFEPELTLEKAWVPMAEREGGLEALDETTQGDSVEGTPHEPKEKEGRRWNRE